MEFTIQHEFVIKLINIVKRMADSVKEVAAFDAA